MKRLCLFLFLSLLAASSVRAEGPDDHYIRIYSLIQAADTLNASGQARDALAKLLEAQTALQQFQKGNPDWNPKIITFRLNDLAEKIRATSDRVPAVAPAKPGPPSAPAVAGPTEQERQLAAAQEDVRRLQAERASLEAKLKEALAAQPAALDPRELAKAQQQIQELMKENELLKATVPADKSAPASTPAPSSRSLEKSRRALDEANRKLKEQTARADALAAEKKILQKRLDSLKSSAGDSAQVEEVRQALAAAKRELADQSKVTKELESEKSALQAQVKSLTTKAAAADSLRAENQRLQKQLADTKSAKTPPVADPETIRKLAAADARIAALQSETDTLRQERNALEDRVKTLSRQPAPAPAVSSTDKTPASLPADVARIERLEKEQKELNRKLEAANKELQSRKGRAAAARLEALTNQLATLRARVEIFEAKAVPYTAEELALFKTPAAELSVTTANSGKKPLRSLPRGAAEFVASAQRHFAAKEYDQAEAAYQELLRRDENNAYTLANLATIQLERGHLDEAEQNATKALKGKPDDAYALCVLGQIKFRQKQYDEALDNLSRAATLDPQNAQIQNHLGLALGHKGLRVPAENALRRALTLDPNYASAHNNLAMIYATQKPPALELARWHYEKARTSGHPVNEELEKVLNAK